MNTNVRGNGWNITNTNGVADNTQKVISKCREILFIYIELNSNRAKRSTFGDLFETLKNSVCKVTEYKLEAMCAVIYL